MACSSRQAVESSNQSCVAGASPPLFFWQSPLTNGFLSQWFDCPFKIPEQPKIIYKTVEHYVAYQKALIFNDLDLGARILKASSPRVACTLAKSPKNFNVDTWYARRFDVILAGNLAKFGGQSVLDAKKAANLTAQLLATGSRELINASPSEPVYGIGYSAEEAVRVDRTKWGKNLLGLALQEIRHRLQEEEQNKEWEFVEIPSKEWELVERPNNEREIARKQDSKE